MKNPIYRAKKSTHIRSFSLTWDNSNYLDGTVKGNYSEVVNRALEHYRTRGVEEVAELRRNIEGLQNQIRNLGEDNRTLRTEIEAQEKSNKAISDNIEPRMGGKWVRFVNFFRFHI